MKLGMFAAKLSWRSAALSGAVLAVQLVAICAVNPTPWSASDVYETTLWAAISTLAILGIVRLTAGAASQPLPKKAIYSAQGDEAKAYMALALGVSHELRQPLFVIQLASRNILSQLGSGTPDLNKVELALARIAVQADKAIAIAASMLDLARAQPRPSEPVAILPAVRACVADWKTVAPGEGIDVSISPGPGSDQRLVAMVDPVGFGQVITNALDNAADSIARKQQSAGHFEGRIDIELENQLGRIICRIRDNGAGVDPRTEQRAFEPFYTTKSTSAGGFGLFLSHEIISRANGTIELLPHQEGGAVLAIELPAA